MGVPQSKHSYVYKPKKKFRKKTLHNSVFLEKPEYLIYDDITLNNSIDDNSKYNTTKSCLDIRAVQKKRDQNRPLSLDEDMLLERPINNISNVMHQYRQEVASQIAKMSPPVGETVSTKSQGSQGSDGFKDVYEDDFYDNQLDSGDFKDAMSYHSLDINMVRPTEVDGIAGKLNKSAEFEIDRVNSERLSRRSSSRRVKVDRKSLNHLDLESKSDPEVGTSSKADLLPLNKPKAAPVESTQSKSDPEAGTSSKVDLLPLDIPQSEPVEPIRQISTESTVEEPKTPQEIITLEDVTNILQDIKDKILFNNINDTEVYHQLLMCKKKAQGIHVTSIKIRAKKTMLIGKINKFIHWFAIAEPNKQESEDTNKEKEVQKNTDTVKTEEEVTNHDDTDTLEIINKVATTEEEQKKIDDIRTVFILNTMKDQKPMPDVDDEVPRTIVQCTNPFITYDDVEETKISIPLQITKNDQPFVDITEDLNNMDSTPISQVYEEINNIRTLLQEVHGKMDTFDGRRYDLEYHNIIDEAFQARIMLKKVKDSQLIEDVIIDDYERFFEDFLQYFEDLVDGNERSYENTAEESEEVLREKKTVRFERRETSTNLTESEDGGSTNFVSLTEYDGKVIEACETFNKMIQLQDDEADLSPEDDFIYKTNAAGDIVFDHEESQKSYIVDPISFSKCRMRPLSIIQEQFDEILDCNYQENQEKPFMHVAINNPVVESEDRDDWDSLDEDMAQEKQLEGTENDEDEEMKEFEELERNIDNIRTSQPDLVLKGLYIDKASQNSEIVHNHHIFGRELRIKDDSGSKITTCPRDIDEKVPSEYEVKEDLNVIKLKKDKAHFEDEIIENIENIDTNGFHSLDPMSDRDSEDECDENSTQKATYENFTIDNQIRASSQNALTNKQEEEEKFVAPQEIQKLLPPEDNPSLSHSDFQDTEEILNPSNYNFASKELKSYNEIMKINGIIDSLQSQINSLSGITKTSPEYMSTFKQIFENMRVLNTIDNCDYQEDLLNLIEYTSDKIQRCIFELDLKVS